MWVKKRESKANRRKPGGGQLTSEVRAGPQAGDGRFEIIMNNTGGWMGIRRNCEPQSLARRPLSKYCRGQRDRDG